MERLYAFIPSVLALVCIAIATRLYMKLVIRRYGDNLKSVEWHKTNQRKVILTLGVPLINVWAPAVEELIFRAPLIIAFSTLSSVAWYGIFASGGLFALSHWFGKKIWMSQIISTRDNGNHKSDDVVAEMDRLYKEAGNRIIVQKALHVILTLPLGILAGYYGIKYQSVWVSFGIHSAWNLMPSAVILFALLVRHLSSASHLYEKE